METDPEMPLVMANGIANQLLSSCLLLVSGTPAEKQIGAAPQYSLEDESGRLKLWAHGFDAINGHLDEVLEYSKYLREPAVLLLANLASCLLGIFKEAKDEHARSLLEQAIQDAINIYPHIDNICYDSGSEGSQGSVFEELHDIVDSLYQLAPALNDVLEKLQAPVNLKLSPITDFYRGLILDKFPNTRLYLVLRLAKGNTRYHERLRSQDEQENVPIGGTIDKNIRVTDKNSARESVQHASASEVPMIEPSHFPRIGGHIQPTPFYDSEIGKSQPPLHPPPSISTLPESSTLSSCSVLKDRHPLPRIPENSGSKSGFKCPICACHQGPVHNSRQWRKHIYSDIKPYMCSYENCAAAETSFKSASQWMSHQNSHRILDDNELSTCPFCFEEFPSSPEKLYRHIGHHMEDIRIFVLPPSYRLQNNCLDGDNSSDTGTPEESLHNISGISINEESSGGPPKSWEKQLRIQGAFNKEKLVRDWISDFGFCSDQKNEGIAPMVEVYGTISEVNYLEGSSKQASMLGDGPVKTRENDGVTDTPQVLYSTFMILPLQRNPNFTGRRPELCEIHEELKGTNSDVSNFRIVVLHGICGIGKTQVALEYAYSHAKEFTSIWWVNGATSENLHKGFFEIAQALVAGLAQNPLQKSEYSTIAAVLGLPPNSINEVGELIAPTKIAIKAAKSWLEALDNQGWLLIIDDYHPENVDLTEFQPNDSLAQGSILITSRIAASRRHGKDLEIVEVMQEDGIEILRKTSQMEAASFDSEKNEATAITNMLRGLPLALEQVGAYIHTTGVDLHKYILLLQKRLARPPGKIPPGNWPHNDTMLNIWEISFSFLETTAQGLLSLCAFFDNEDICEELLSSYLKELGIDSIDNLDSIFSLSFVKRRNSRSGVWIHPLVHSWLRERLNKTERKKMALDAISLTAAAVRSVKTNDSTQSIEYYSSLERRLMPHIERCYDHICRNSYLATGMPKTNPCVFQDVGALAEVSYKGAQYSQAEELYQWALKGQEMLLGEFNPSTLSTIHSIALVYDQRGSYKEALKWYEKAYKGRKKTLSYSHPDTLDTAHRVASVYNRQRKYKQALQWYKIVLSGKKEILGSDHRDKLDTVHSIASIYGKQGKYDEALKWYERALSGGQEVLGEIHPYTLKTIYGIASVYYLQRKYDEALKRYQRVLSGREEVLGSDHCDTLKTVHSIASIYDQQGKYDEALKLYERALSGRIRVLGGSHPDTLCTTYNIALVCYQQGNYNKARKLYERAFYGREEVLGEMHPYTLNTIHGIASSYGQQGRHKKALIFYKQLLVGRSQALGSDHPHTLETVHNIALVYYHQGKYSEAFEWYQRALISREEVLGRDHPDTLDTIHDIAWAYSKQGWYEPALKWYERALAGRKKVLGPEHPNTLDTVSAMAVVPGGEARVRELGYTDSEAPSGNLGQSPEGRNRTTIICAADRIIEAEGGFNMSPIVV